MSPFSFTLTSKNASIGVRAVGAAGTAGRTTGLSDQCGPSSRPPRAYSRPR
ncbi:hypothetical protein FRUB_08541 [Fimbriiglobus ruber]|uniref:Uncharacterized protein n=1 Tax=Fimbriiglobus ruber TaxID=1908690 RepID=A0A225DBS4_9BACT|nr:hypothetical protein FRUB_08541 [Fimbriiglobus ruber]